MSRDNGKTFSESPRSRCRRSDERGLDVDASSYVTGIRPLWLEHRLPAASRERGLALACLAGASPRLLHRVSDFRLCLKALTHSGWLAAAFGFRRSRQRGRRVGFGGVASRTVGWHVLTGRPWRGWISTSLRARRGRSRARRGSRGRMQCLSPSCFASLRARRGPMQCVWFPISFSQPTILPACEAGACRSTTLGEATSPWVFADGTSSLQKYPS